MEASCPEIEVFHSLTQDRSTSMTDQAMSPLRRRMIEDMAIRKFGQKTQHDYVRSVKDFAKFLGRSPDTAKPEEVRRFQLHLTSSGAGVSKINQRSVALRFFFNVTLDRPELAKQLAFIHVPRKIPVVLSSEEVTRFLEAAPSIKYKAAFSVAYGAGLRVSEVASLKVSDIDSKRMMLRVEQGKGRKDRHAMLSPRLLELLRDWYRNADTRIARLSGDVGSRNPTTGTAPCCARAASGHAAAPPTSIMKSRRRITRSPRRRARAAWAKARC
jgi:integrase